MRTTAPDPRREAERWFLRNGLPYFVGSERRVVQQGLTRSRLLPVLGTAALVGLVAGFGLALLTRAPAGTPGRYDVSGAIVVGLWAGAIVLWWYAATTLRLRIIATWAVRRTFAGLRLMIPLITRALPLLLLFVTFLFINTEVWMVASSLDPGVLTMAVMFFALLAVLFLLVRLPEEIDRLDDDLDVGRLVRRCAGTPVEGHAATALRGEQAPPDMNAAVEVTGLQRANLILVLLVSQAVQVLLVAVVVLVFFLVFGTLVMQDSVVEVWLGVDNVAHVPGLAGLTAPLIKVSVFLAGFSGLYFSVVAVTDETYRGQFFTAITHEMERAVAVRAVYRQLG